MKFKTMQYPLDVKVKFLLMIGVLLAFLLLVFIVNSNSSSPAAYQPPSAQLESWKASSVFSKEVVVVPSTSCPPSSSSSSTSSCSKIPPSLAQALIHYSTSNVTPQQTLKEISVTWKVLEKRSPCNFLVFGLGHDSLMWSALNHGGRTVFLEEDRAWIDQIKQRFPTLESHHVVYDTKVRQAEDLLKVGKREECAVVGDPRSSKCRLALKGMPDEIYEIEWDLIMVDAPTGYFEDAPGRMTALYTAGLMARNRKDGDTDVFVHDVDRLVEDKFSRAFLCDGYMREQQGRLRHFTIPSQTLGASPGDGLFCP
nr:TPA_asm: hypothetical protein HUJ06_012989 [Nelumbo nucifera]